MALFRMAILFIVASLTACGPGSPSTGNLQRYSQPSIGSATTLEVRIYNNTQWPLNPTVNGTQYPFNITPGGHFSVIMTTFPGVVVVEADAFRIPPYSYPSKIYIAGRDYVDQGTLSVGFP